MSVYPTSNPQWVAPVVRSLKFQTGIGQGVSGTEQRWMLTTGVESWSLPYPHLSVAQRDTLLSLFESSKGGYDQTISLTFGGTTYTGLYFDARRMPARSLAISRCWAPVHERNGHIRTVGTSTSRRSGRRAGGIPIRGGVPRCGRGPPAARC